MTCMDSTNTPQPAPEPSASAGPSCARVTGSGLHWPCECRNWCRTDIQFRDGKPLPITNHHPRCQYVDETLIDVWRLTIDGASCLFDDEPLTAEMDLEPGSFTVTKERMHAEVFRALPEFSGW
jgi:hypothetical protein